MHSLSATIAHSYITTASDNPTAPTSTTNRTNSSSPFPQTVPNEAEQALIQRVFQLHFDLFSATDACSRGVRRCARTDFGHLAASIAETLEAIGPYKHACNPLVQSLVAGTMELLQD